MEHNDLIQLKTLIPASFEVTLVDGPSLHFKQGTWQGVLDEPLSVLSAASFAWQRELTRQHLAAMQVLREDYQRARHTAESNLKVMIQAKYAELEAQLRDS